MAELHDTSQHRAGLFPETMWSAISQVRGGDDAAALAALDTLARAYWRPLYVYVRGTGCAHAEAADAVQGFFATLISRDSLRAVTKGGSKFRSFLLSGIRRWLASDARRDFALKRGAGVEPLAMDDLESSEIPAADGVESPEQALDRAWAREVFDHAFSRLEKDAAERGRADIFQILRPVLLGAAPEGGYVALGEKVGASEGTARKMVFDLRARLGQFLRDEVLQTVATPQEADDELRYLLGLL